MPSYLEHKIKTLDHLSKIFTMIGDNSNWSNFEIGITEEEFNELNEAVKYAKVKNGWFEESEVRKAFANWGVNLNAKNIKDWLSDYNIPSELKKMHLAVIGAGNIPLVIFHDALVGYLFCERVTLKLSSDDDYLFTKVLEIWKKLDPEIETQTVISDGKLTDFDAVIATGSNNSARYFKQYFGHVPNIIRKNRTSVAIIKGDEKAEELEKLGLDIFSYFGLGCRNVTKIYFPENYKLDIFFEAIFKYSEVINNKKYANNYDYHKALFLLEAFDLRDNGFVLLKEDDKLVSPVGTLYYEFYNDLENLRKRLEKRSSEIQCVISQDDLTFGESQHPSLNQYADNVDTVKFILEC